MIPPKNLVKGDLIAIVSPAGKVKRETILPAINLLKTEGYKILIGESVFESSNIYAGTLEQRVTDFQKAIDNRDVKVIICTRGGYGSLQVLEHIDWQEFQRNPKWIVGFSDITVVHSKLTQLKVQSIHGPMLSSFVESRRPTTAYYSVINNCSGKRNDYQISTSTLNRTGEAVGQIIGGNLSIIYSLQATSLELMSDNYILFIEDIGEYLYHLDRMMLNLRLSGKLAKLKGLIVGKFTDMKNGTLPYGKNAYQIIRDHTEQYDFPICFDFQAGHTTPNYPLILGKKSRMLVASDRVEINN